MENQFCEGCWDLFQQCVKTATGEGGIVTGCMCCDRCCSLDEGDRIGFGIDPFGIIRCGSLFAVCEFFGWDRVILSFSSSNTGVYFGCWEFFSEDTEENKTDFIETLIESLQVGIQRRALAELWSQLQTILWNERIAGL